MTKEMRETVRHYLILSGTVNFGISFVSAFYVTFLMANGLNYLDVNLVNFAYWTTLTVCEMPTGAFADVFGRKLSFLIFCVLFAVGMLAYGFATSFWGFVGAEIILGVGQTFSNGAFQAWFVDRLKQQGYPGPFKPIFARKQFINGGVGMVAAVTGAFLGSINMVLPWFFGSAMMVVAGCVAVKYMQEDRKKEEGPRMMFFTVCALKLREMVTIIISSLHYARSSSAVRFILIITAVQYFAIQAPNMQWQPLFRDYLESPTSLGFVKAGIAMAIMLGAWLVRRYGGMIADEHRAISWIQIWIGLGIATTVLFQSFAPALALFLMHEIPRGMLDPVKEAYLHDNIPADRRATIASCDSVANHIGGMIGLLVSGVLAQYLGLSSAWIVSGLVLVVSALLFFRNGHAA